MKSFHITTEVAYILGALRDGSIDIRKGKNYEVRFGQKNREWLITLQAMFQSSFGYGGTITKHLGIYYILRITRKAIVKEIQEFSGFVKPQSKWGTPRIIKHQSPSILRWHVRGFFDAEGGTPEDPQKWRYVSFDQKNKESLKFIRNVMIRFGYTPTNLTFTSSVWQFRLTRNDDLVRFCRWMKPLHPDKRAALRLLAKWLN